MGITEISALIVSIAIQFEVPKYVALLVVFAIVYKVFQKFFGD